MSIVSKLQNLFTDNRISNLDEAFEEQDTELPVGIYMHYADKEHKEESTIVIRQYQDGSTGDVLISLELEMDTWYIRDHNHTVLTEVTGKNNYDELAQEIVSHLESITA